MTAKNYLKNRWIWQNEGSDEVKFAKGKVGVELVSELLGETIKSAITN